MRSAPSRTLGAFGGAASGILDRVCAPRLGAPSRDGGRVAVAIEQRDGRFGHAAARLPGSWDRTELGG